MVKYIISKEYDEMLIIILNAIVLVTILYLICIEKYKEISWQYLLESPKKYYLGKERIFDISKKNVLYSKLEDFVKKYQGFNYIVSLSGGVDSMVTLAILMNIVDNNNIYTGCIDYNQRIESSAEINFISNYLSKYKVKNYSRKVVGVHRKKENYNRKVFEETSQKIRYNLYEDIIKFNKLEKDKTIILLGHHLDDLKENIFNNFMSGRKLSDLEVMKELTKKNNLLFGRPFLDYSKNEIYNIAHKYDIPYLKDTTPNWSKRGLMRKQLFPLLKKIYPNFDKTIQDQGENSYYVNCIFKDYFVDDFLSNVIIKRDTEITEIIWDNKKFECEYKLIWSDRISRLLHKEGINMISHKSLNNFMDNKICKLLVLSKNVKLKRSGTETCLIIKK